MLIYKIIKGIGTAAISGAVFGTFSGIMRRLRSPAYMACVLSLVFLQVLSIAIMLLALNVPSAVLESCAAIHARGNPGGAGVRG